MLEAIARIRGYTADMDLAAFQMQTLIQDAVIRNIEIVGEAARNVMRNDPEFATAHPEVPWTEAIRMRDRISHGYFSVELDTIWKTVQHDLPKIEAEVSVLLGSLPRQ
jgi:uncharacterized protein with HEPN domain